MLPLAITTGEPAGIGPRLCAALAPLAARRRIVLLGDRDWLQNQMGTGIPLRDYAPGNPVGTLEVLHHPLAAPVTPGQLDVRNAPYVLALLDRAIQGCQHHEFAALVTCPIQKSVICEGALTSFTGHTEYLAEKTATPRVVMMLASDRLRVALATTHLPLAAVPAAITHDTLTETLTILLRDLRQRFRIPRPRILIAGLNPHAGENGHMGDEEIRTIAPALHHIQTQDPDCQLIGPLPADTLFTPHRLEHADAVLAMYHDQGLAPFKYASFGGGVNITLGLPILRTSVDHGTALDLAATGQPADPGSLLAAVQLADNLSTS